MLKIINKNKKQSFVVADYKGIKKLRNTSGYTITVEHLSCGHYIYPPLGTHSHASVDCPICGDEYIMKDMETVFNGKNAHLNGTKGRTFCMNVETIGGNYLK